MSRPPDIPREIFKFSQVCAYLQFGKRKVRDLIEKHDLPTLRMPGGQLRFIRRDVDRWLRRFATNPAGDDPGLEAAADQVFNRAGIKLICNEGGKNP